MIRHLLLKRRLPSCATIFKNYRDYSQKSLYISNPLYCRRNFSVGSRLFANYEGDGKTVVTILNEVQKDIIMINSYSTIGFRLNNGVFVVGPIALFPKTVLQWNVGSSADINPAALSLFAILEPKIDLLIFGTGEKSESLTPEVLSFLKEKRISHEVLTTSHACETFNFLNAEGRCIAGAIIPPEKVAGFDHELELVNEIKTFEPMQ